MRISDWSSDVCSSDLALHDVRVLCRNGGHGQDENGDEGDETPERLREAASAACLDHCNAPRIRYVPPAVASAAPYIRQSVGGGKDPAPDLQGSRCRYRCRQPAARTANAPPRHPPQTRPPTPAR